jgi:hypothetical protein
MLTMLALVAAGSLVDQRIHPRKRILYINKLIDCFGLAGKFSVFHSAEVNDEPA